MAFRQRICWCSDKIYVKIDYYQFCLPPHLEILTNLVKVLSANNLMYLQMAIRQEMFKKSKFSLVSAAVLTCSMAVLLSGVAIIAARIRKKHEANQDPEYSSVPTAEEWTKTTRSKPRPWILFSTDSRRMNEKKTKHEAYHDRPWPWILLGTDSRGMNETTRTKPRPWILFSTDSRGMNEE